MEPPVRKVDNRPLIGLIDDDVRMLRFVAHGIEAGYRCVTASDGPSGLQMIEEQDPDLLVLDILMPGMDGVEVLRRLREFTWLPVIILSGKYDETDIVRALEAGADDYVTKPFQPRELLARIRAALRRASFVADERHSSVLKNGPLTIDYAQHLVTLEGREIPLTPTEYRLLACLGQNVGRTLTQEDILLRVWGNGYQDENHLLRVMVARLRGKLGEDAESSRYVMTRPGVGYTMPSMSSMKRLGIFLAHFSADKPAVQRLRRRLRRAGFDPWLDKDRLLAGQAWELEIAKAVRRADVVLVCLSKAAVGTKSYLHKEIAIALDLAQEQPEGTIYVVPLRLDDCNVPMRLRQLQWKDLFEPRGFSNLVAALQERGRSLGLSQPPRSDLNGQPDGE